MIESLAGESWEIAHELCVKVVSQAAVLYGYSLGPVWQMSVVLAKELQVREKSLGYAPGRRQLARFSLPDHCLVA